MQRTDSALRLNVHFHVLALDGVYVRDKSNGRLLFHALGTPTRAEVADVAADPVAEVHGVNVHARQRVDGRDRRQLERLARYITRPPIAQDRLTVRSDGTLELALKSIWKDGTRAIVFSPEDLVLRLIAAIPPPRWHT